MLYTAEEFAKDMRSLRFRQPVPTGRMNTHVPHYSDTRPVGEDILWHKSLTINPHRPNIWIMTQPNLTPDIRKIYLVFTVEFGDSSNTIKLGFVNTHVAMEFLKQHTEHVYTTYIAPLIESTYNLSLLTGYFVFDEQGQIALTFEDRNVALTKVLYKPIQQM